MHRLLRKQWTKAHDQSGALDVSEFLRVVSATYDDMDRDRKRADRSISLMVEELAELTSRLEEKVTERTAELEATRRLLNATLDNVDQGITMIDPEGKVTVFNRRAAELLDLPSDLAERRLNIVHVAEMQRAAGEFENLPNELVRLFEVPRWSATGWNYERRRRNGDVLRIHTVELDDGSFVRTYADVTEERLHEQKLLAAEAEYRSLFENALTGIYRSSLDGKQLRANPALVKLNGYETEAEMLAAVNDIGGEWYVDPKRRDAFREAIERDGRVDDFVSEIYRHRTRERIWISETAWLVRAPEGTALYYEGTVIDCTRRMQAEAKIAFLAHNDALTGVMARSAFREALLAASSEATSFAVHCLDLDRFKEVNDTLGHPAGDRLLRLAALRLQGALPPDALLARLGGDEFAVLQPGVADRAEAAALAANLHAAMASAFDLGGARVHVGASVGVVLAPEDGADPETLMKNADIALYRAKSEGRSTYRFFDASMAEDIRRRRDLENDLRGAAGRGELDAYLQPIVDIRSGETISYEALIRWRHPEHGLLTPSDFIPLAEETGLIVAIGEWILLEVCTRMADSATDLPVSVNLSPVQIREGGVVEIVRDALAYSGLPASRLVIEITETSLLMDDVGTIGTLRDLRAMGVRIALDDFGTGHSALSYLRKFPFDIIKIDRSFVAPEGDDHVKAVLLRAILSLGVELGIAVVAEGVETIEQCRNLRELGAIYAQGYLFGRPLLASEYLDEAARARCESCARGAA